VLASHIAHAIRTLIAGEHPHTSWLGIGLSVSSIIVMPQLGKAKHRIGHRLGSGATAGEGTQNLLCAYLAAGVLASVALNARIRLWWAGPAVALSIAAHAIKEASKPGGAPVAAAASRSTSTAPAAAPTTAVSDRFGLARSAARQRARVGSHHNDRAGRRSPRTRSPGVQTSFDVLTSPPAPTPPPTRADRRACRDLVSDHVEAVVRGEVGPTLRVEQNRARRRQRDRGPTQTRARPAIQHCPAPPPSS